MTRKCNKGAFLAGDSVVILKKIGPEKFKIRDFGSNATSIYITYIYVFYIYFLYVCYICCDICLHMCCICFLYVFYMFYICCNICLSVIARAHQLYDIPQKWFEICLCDIIYDSRVYIYAYIWYIYIFIYDIYICLFCVGFTADLRTHKKKVTINPITHFDIFEVIHDLFFDTFDMIHDLFFWYIWCDARSVFLIYLTSFIAWKQYQLPVLHMALQYITEPCCYFRYIEKYLFSFSFLGSLLYMLERVSKGALILTLKQNGPKRV